MMVFKNLRIALNLNKIRSFTGIISLNRNINQYRSHYCNELCLNDVGKEVTICGWVKTIRLNKFILIKDSSSEIVQIYLNDDFNLNKVSNESVIKIKGIVRARPPGQENLNLKTGRIEIECSDLEIVNKCKANLPILINDFENNNPNELLRLKYRYLDLRNQNMQNNIRFRHNFVSSVRNFLNENKFLDIETPTLFRRTPGGAREFLVPTRHDKKFYCLTQSPQQFKQLLMCAGFEKYYQIARCYRDEELKADRQPEFTQIDIEMSFINEDNCIELIESLFDKCWPFKETNPIKVPFKRMKFDDALKYYGSDKPDLRFDMKFKCLNKFFQDNLNCGLKKIETLGSNICSYAFKIPLNLCNNKLELFKYEKLEKIFSDTFNEGDVKGDFVILIVDNVNEKVGGSKIVSKFMKKDFHSKLIQFLNMDDTGEISIILASSVEKEMKLLELLGQLRLNVANYIDNLNSKLPDAKLLRDPNKFEFLWITDFPLFTLDTKTGKYETTHHPFTAPKSEHLDGLLTKTLSLSHIKGQHYDLVLNGCEIAGGSIRINKHANSNNRSKN